MYQGLISTAMLCLVLFGTATAQVSNGLKPWTLKTRLTITSTSDGSEPAGFKAYSGLALDAGISRRLCRYSALELTFTTVSREVDYSDSLGVEVSLGAMEILPLNLRIQYKLPTQGKWQPYAGGGVNFTKYYEKSGTLNAQKVASTVGPTIQLGLDMELTPIVLLNADLSWVKGSADISIPERKIASIKLDPLTIGLGAGFRF